MDSYTLIILLALFGFLALAVILLLPVYRFLKKEEQRGEQWTRHIRAMRSQQPSATPNGDPPSNGASPTDGTDASGRA